MVGTAATSSKSFASAGMACSCHRTTRPIAKLAKARPLRVQCAPLILEVLISRIPQRIDPAALGNAGVEFPQSLFHVAINPGDGLLPSLLRSRVGHVL